MIHWILPAQKSEVSPFVEHYWFLKKDAVAELAPRLNPDPAAHLILAEADTAYSYQCDELTFSGTGSHWLFPYRKTLRLDHSRAQTLIGIKFHVGALYRLHACLAELISDAELVPGMKLIPAAERGPASEFPSQAEDLIDQILRADISVLFASPQLLQQLLVMAEQDPEACRTQLDRVISAWLVSVEDRIRCDKHSRLCTSVLPLLNDTSITQCGEKLHCSQRTLERSFRRVVGLSLKQVQSMNRFEAMLAYLYQRQPQDIDWVDVAFRFGFSDQPHLIRQLKATIGVTPGDYLQQRDLTIDVYGGVEYLG